MKRLTTFFCELKREELFSSIYNGFNLLEDDVVSKYESFIERLYEDAINALIENPNSDRNVILKRLYEVLDEIPQYLSIRESQISQNEKSLIEKANSCHNIKYCSALRFEKYLNGNDVKEIQIEIIPEGTSKQNANKRKAITKNYHQPNDKVIKGIVGLANYLGCGRNKAQEISNSTILQDEGIQYKIGRDWFFIKQKLDDYISKNPNAFCNIRRTFETKKGTKKGTKN